jgi:hypothetical protein
LGRVSRAPRELSAARNCTRDEGGPFDQKPADQWHSLQDNSMEVLGSFAAPAYYEEDAKPCIASSFTALPWNILSVEGKHEPTR